VSNPPIVGLVPARIGSKRIRGKNFKKLSGHSLVYWAVRSAVESGVFEDVVISTDHTGYITQDILDIGGHGFHRPKEYATDTSPDVEWIRHAMTETFCKQYPSFAILRPTSPFRTAAMIRRAYAEFCDAGRAIDSLRAVERVSQHPGKMWTLQRDTRPYRLMPLLPQPEYPWHSSQMAALPEVWVQNASMEIAWINTIERYGNQAGEVVAPFFTEGHEGFDINDEHDWKAAEMLVAEDPGLLPPVRKEDSDGPA
jgi:CMP-N,N'-diacetyllegionaminic acid synthase